MADTHDADDHAPKPPPMRREPVFNLPVSITVIIVACAGIHLLRTQFDFDALNRFLILNFAFFPVRYTGGYAGIDLGTLVSPVGYSFLHGDWVHLGLNMVWLAAFGAPVAWRLGSVRVALFWIITALGAVFLHLVLYWGDSVPLIGASGAVSGFMGAAARFGFRPGRAGRAQGFTGPLYGPLACLKLRGVAPFLLVWMVINYLAGAGFFSSAGDAEIAWEAHIGGLVTGYFLIGLIDPGPRKL